MTKARNNKRKMEKGFTLMELLVVVAVIGILTAVAMPNYHVYRARAYNARVVADVRSAATAQEAYYADNISYATGVCSTLPGVRGSAGVTCNTTGTTNSFTVTASHPSATKSCTWNSAPTAGSPSLVCS